MNARFAAVTAFVLLSAAALVGCTTQLAPAPPTGTATPGAPGAADNGTGTGQNNSSLPDSVPLPTDAQLAEASKSFSSDRARGWTAVALTPNGSGLSGVAGQLTQSLQTAGWATKVTGGEKDGFVIASTRKVGAESAWLNINVTTPVPGSGPAVTYRYAVGQVGTSTPSKGAAR